MLQMQTTVQLCRLIHAKPLLALHSFVGCSCTRSRRARSSQHYFSTQVRSLKHQLTVSNEACLQLKPWQSKRMWPASCAVTTKTYSNAKHVRHVLHEEYSQLFARPAKTTHAGLKRSRSSSQVQVRGRPKFNVISVSLFSVNVTKISSCSQ